MKELNLKLPNKGKFRRVKVGAFAMTDMIISAYQQGQDNIGLIQRDEETAAIAESVNLHARIRDLEYERKTLIDRINSVTEHQWDTIKDVIDSVYSKLPNHGRVTDDLVQEAISEAKKQFKPK